MRCGCGWMEVLDVVWMWRYKLRCGCSRLEVIDAVWEWLFGVIRRNVDVVNVRY